MVFRKITSSTLMTRTLEILPNELTEGTGTVTRRSGSQELFTPLIVIPELSNEPDLQMKPECISIWIIYMNSLVTGMFTAVMSSRRAYKLFHILIWCMKKSINWRKFDPIYSCQIFFNENRKDNSILANAVSLF